VILPYSVQSVGDNAFSWCSSLKKAVIPAGVESLGDALFEYTVLEEVTLPFAGNTAEGVEKNETSTLRRLLFGTFNNADSDKLRSITITGGSSIPESAFGGFTTVSEINLPNTITVIHNSAFSTCISLESIDIPDRVTTIGDNAFYRCSLIPEVIIPERVETIGNSAFAYCSSISEVILPDSVQSVGDNVFSWCSSLKKAVIPAGVKSLGNALFEYTALEEVTLPFAGNTAEGVEKNETSTMRKLLFGTYSNADSDKLRSITITGGSSIPESAFGGFTTVSEINLPNTITVIHNSAFSTCTSLERVMFTGNAPVIASNAFTSVTTNAYYFKTDTTWTTDKLQNYGGTITWTPISPLVIKEQPANCAAPSGEYVKTKVVASGDGLKYQWYFCEANGTKFMKSGVTGATYSAEMKPSKNGRRIYCVITDQYGFTVQSNTVTLYMGKPVTIVEQPTNGIAPSGKIAKTAFTAEGEGLSYQWYFCEPGNTRFKLSSVTDAAYTCEMTEAKNGRRVYCVVTDRFGYTAKTDIVTLYMGTPLVIKMQPTNDVAPLGEEVKTVVTANGDGLKYQWYLCEPGNKTFQKSSVKLPVYSYNMTEAKNGRKVYCVITDQYGFTVQTNTVTLYMGTPVTISEQPTNAIASSGKNAVIRFTAVGEGLSYQWYLCEPGEKNFKKSSVTAPVYTTQMTAAKNGCRVYCVVTDRFGCTAKTDTVTLYMGTPLEITKQPTNAIAPSEKIAKTAFTAVGEGLKYQWYFCEAGGTKFKLSSVTDSAYTCKMTAAKNGRRVYCVVTDKFGFTAQTNTVTLYMGTPLEITKQPTNGAAPLGEEVKTMVTANGDGLKYQWYLCEPGNKTFQKSSVKLPVYSYNMTEAKNGRKVYCVITDQYGFTVQTNTVTLYMGTPVTIAEQPTNDVALSGKTVKTAVIANGEELKYQWYFCEAGGTKFKLSSVTTPEYSYKMTEAKNGRRVYCVVTDRFGISVTTDVATLYMGTPLEITKQPTNDVALSGKTVKTTVIANGEELKYQWYFCEAGGTKFKLSSVTTPEYSYKMTDAKNGRRVYCVVTDRFGISVTTDVATLYMGTPMEITNQPKNASASLNAVVTTRVTATGDGLKYQWYLCEAGSTTFKKSSVTLPVYSYNMTEAKNGRKVYCVITDKYGVSVTTDTATLSMK